jgi:hypothetical protein
MADVAMPLVIETTAGEMAAELERRGISRDQPITVMIEPNGWLGEARRYSRPLVIAEGWSDEDIDKIIHEEREAVRGPRK